MSAFRVLCASDPSSSTLSRVCAPCCRGAREPSIVKLHAPVRPPSWLVTLNLSRNPLTAMDPTMFPGVLRLKYPGLTRHPKLVAAVTGFSKVALND